MTDTINAVALPAVNNHNAMSNESIDDCAVYRERLLSCRINAEHSSTDHQTTPTATDRRFTRQATDGTATVRLMLAGLQLRAALLMLLLLLLL